MTFTISSSNNGKYKEIRIKGFENVFLICHIQVDGIFSYQDPLFLTSQIRYILIDRDSMILLFFGNSYSAILFNLESFLNNKTQEDINEYLKIIRY